MSFKLKTILLALLVGLIPYLIMIGVFTAEVKDDMIGQARSEMQMRSNSILSLISYELKLFENDLNSSANMDIMADILSSDLDGRIAEMLKKKKESFALVGDYYVTNADGVLVASTSDKVANGGRYAPLVALSVPIISSLKPVSIGTIYLEYSPENFNKFLTSTASQKFSIVPSQKTPPKASFVILNKIESMNSYALMGVLEEGALLESYDKAEMEMFLYLLCGVFLISIIAYFVASRMVQPLLNMSYEASQIAITKEYSERLSVSTKDELSIVASAFNNLLSSIEDALAKLKLESQNKLRLIEAQSKNDTLSVIAKKLSKYLSPQIVESIISGEKESVFGSHRKKLTIFFSDIVGFTSTTDTMEAEDLSALLNNYLNEMSQIALSHGATIDKFIGDAIMVFFGDPQSRGDKEDALSCVKMAIEMIEKLDELEEHWHAKGISQPFKVRIGIHTGYCTVGNFGNEERMDYTIIGGAVNLTSRIESSAKPNQILISEETQLLVSDFVACEFVDTITVKGIAHPVKLYEAAGLKSASETIRINQNGVQIKLSMDKIGDKKAVGRQLLDIVQQLQG